MTTKDDGLHCLECTMLFTQMCINTGKCTNCFTSLTVQNWPKVDMSTIDDEAKAMTKAHISTTPVVVSIIKKRPATQCPHCKDVLYSAEVSMCNVCGIAHHMTCFSEMAAAHEEDEERPLCASMNCNPVDGEDGDGEFGTITINDTVHVVDSIDHSDTEDARITTADGAEFLLVLDQDVVDAMVRSRYIDEIECLIGEETLVQWAIECINGGPSPEAKFNDLMGELDSGKELAPEDGIEHDIGDDNISAALVEELGWTPEYAYCIG